MEGAVKHAARIALAAALLAGPTMAQAPSLTYQQDKPAAKEPPVEQVGGLRFVDTAEVTIVNVDVSVTDKNGPVLGLSKDDFEVFQDGQAQEITNFHVFVRETSTPPTPAPSAAAAEVVAPRSVEPGVPERKPRFVALYIDNENLLPQDRNRALDKLKEFVADYLRPPDQMMVVSYQKSFKVLQRFTSDPESILSALRLAAVYTGGRASVDSERASIEDDITDTRGRRGEDAHDAAQRVVTFAREQRNDLVLAVRSLQQMVTTMSGLPGKKAIIYLSDGLPMTPGLELFQAYQEELHDASVVASAMQFQSGDLFRGLATSAGAAGVTLYTIDARGLQVSLGTEAERRMPRSTLTSNLLRSNYQDSLIFMADETGGTAIINTNDIKPGLDRIGRELSNYYSLGYRLVPSGSDRMHRLEVKLKEPSDYRLNYPKMFIEKTLPSRVADRVGSGLAYDLDDNPLGIEIETGETTPGNGDFLLLPLQIKVPIDKVALIPAGEDYAGYLMAYYAARDDQGKQSDLVRTEHTVEVARADLEKVSGQYFTVKARLLLEPGTYRISVGVRDELTNQAGYAVVRRLVRPN